MFNVKYKGSSLLKFPVHKIKATFLSKYCQNFQNSILYKDLHSYYFPMIDIKGRKQCNGNSKILCILISSTFQGWYLTIGSSRFEEPMFSPRKRITANFHRLKCILKMISVCIRTIEC